MIVRIYEGFLFIYLLYFYFILFYFVLVLFSILFLFYLFAYYFLAILVQIRLSVALRYHSRKQIPHNVAKRRHADKFTPLKRYIYKRLI